MNIDNNLGMALFSKDLSGTAAIGDFQSMTNGVSENPEGSLFQQLISQMLTEKNNQMTEALGDNLIGGEKGKSVGIGQLLSELISGGNLAQIRLMNEEKETGESSGTNGQAKESVSMDENSEALEAIQALMGGLTNAFPAANIVKVLQETRIEKSSPEPSSAVITSVKTAISDLGMLETQKYIPSNPEEESNPDEMTVLANGKATVQDEKTDQTEASPILQADGKIVQTDATFRRQLASISNDGLKAAYGKSEMQEGISAQEFKISEPGTVKLTTAAETQTQEAIPDYFNKPKLETEMDSESQDRMSFQNTMQGAVSTSEVKEPSSLAQPVEASEPYNQIREEILSKLEQKGSTEFKMQLHPEDLGQIDIKLKLSEGKLVIDILAANSKTQALLTGQVDKLIASMGLQNVQVESVHVSQQMNFQTQDNSQSQGYTMSSGMDFSQRRQQEQLPQEILNGSKVTGTFNLQQNEAQNNNLTNRIESVRYDSHRMNYAV